VRHVSPPPLLLLLLLLTLLRLLVHYGTVHDVANANSADVSGDMRAIMF